MKGVSMDRQDSSSVEHRQQTAHFRQGNSVTEQAFLERVLWQQSGKQVRERQKPGGRGHLGFAATTSEEMMRLCAKTVTKGKSKKKDQKTQRRQNRLALLTRKGRGVGGKREPGATPEF